MNWYFTKRIRQLGLIKKKDKHTEPAASTNPPLQVAPPKLLPTVTSRPQQPPTPPPTQSYSLGNETEIKKHMKTLELKKGNERIHQLTWKNCLIVQTFNIRHNMKKRFK